MTMNLKRLKKPFKIEKKMIQIVTLLSLSLKF